MKKRYRSNITVFTLVTAMLFSGIAPGAPGAVAKTTVKLDKTKLGLYVGEKSTVKIKGLSKGKKATWKIADKKLLKKVKSSKTSVTVKALKKGKTTIKAKVSKKTYTCKVTIKKSVVKSYKNHENFARAVSDMIIANPVKSSGAIAAKDHFFTKRLIVQTKKSDVSFSEYEPTAVLKDDENICILQFETSDKAKDAFQKIANLPDVEWAEPDLYIGTDETDVESGKSSPDKKIAKTQKVASEKAAYDSLSWGVERLGADTYATKTSKSSITVAVVDTGVDSSHPFLQGRTVAGYDYVQNDADPTDEHFHGTHVAGTIVDCTPDLNVKIMPVRVLDAGGYGWSTTIGLGIRYAADNGAKVINLSLGGGHSSYEDSCIQYALNKGVTIVCAAGNDSSNTANFCPAHIESIIVVAAIDDDEDRAYFSNYGNSVDVAAPGVDILSCIPGGQYSYLQGTSMASPHVAALAAMIKLNFPNSTPGQIESTLKSCCRDLGTSGWDAYYGYGIPDMTKDGIAPPVNTPTPTPTPTVKPTPTLKPTPTPTIRPTRTPVVTPTPTIRPTSTPRATWPPAYTQPPVYTWPPAYTQPPVRPTATPIPTSMPNPGEGTDRGYTYRVTSSQTAIITGYTGAGGNLTIPLELGGYPVSGIGDGAFKGNTAVRSVRIQGITWIGVSAFENCGLTSVYIDGIVSGVSSRAFAANPSLSGLTITGMFLQVQPDIFKNCPALMNPVVYGMIDDSVRTALNIRL